MYIVYVYTVFSICIQLYTYSTAYNSRSEYNCVAIRHYVQTKIEKSTSVARKGCNAKTSLRSCN